MYWDFNFFFFFFLLSDHNNYDLQNIFPSTKISFFFFPVTVEAEL